MELSVIVEKSKDNLRRTLSDVGIRDTEFDRPVTRCDIATCLGTCCYDGVYVDETTEELIQAVVRSEAQFFATIGVFEATVVVDGEFPMGGVAGRKTDVHSFDFSATVSGFPAHFSNTSCVLRLP
jgi:hypothetical protein